jgi:hypothetical protein
VTPPVRISRRQSWRQASRGAGMGVTRRLAAWAWRVGAAESLVVVKVSLTVLITLLSCRVHRIGRVAPTVRHRSVAGEDHQPTAQPSRQRKHAQKSTPIHLAPKSGQFPDADRDLLYRVYSTPARSTVLVGGSLRIHGSVGKRPREQTRRPFTAVRKTPQGVIVSCWRHPVKGFVRAFFMPIFLAEFSLISLQGWRTLR